jgi:hypothetical protein
MNKNIKKILKEYEHEIAFHEDSSAIKARLQLVSKPKTQEHPYLLRALTYAGTAVFFLTIALPLGYLLGNGDVIGTPQIVCDTIAAAEAYLLVNYDESLRTPVLTFFSDNQYQISLYFAIDDGDNQCFYVIVSDHNPHLTFVNDALPLNIVTPELSFGSFVIDSDASTDFTMSLIEGSTLVKQWDVVFDIPAYLSYI